MQQRYVRSFLKKETGLWHLWNNCGCSECVRIGPSNFALTGKGWRPARLVGTVTVPTYAHVLPLPPQFLRNDSGMQINCTSQAKKFSIKARKSLPECLPTWIPQLGYEWFTWDFSYWSQKRPSIVQLCNYSSAMQELQNTFPVWHPKWKNSFINV